jgi:hypothetical protein
MEISFRGGALIFSSISSSENINPELGGLSGINSTIFVVLLAETKRHNGSVECVDGKFRWQPPYVP